MLPRKWPSNDLYDWWKIFLKVTDDFSQKHFPVSWEWIPDSSPAYFVELWYLNRLEFYFFLSFVGIINNKTNSSFDFYNWFISEIFLKFADTWTVTSVNEIMSLTMPRWQGSEYYQTVICVPLLCITCVIMYAIM